MNRTKEYSSRLLSSRKGIEKRNKLLIKKSTQSRTLSAMVGAWADEHGLELETIATS